MRIRLAGGEQSTTTIIARALASGGLHVADPDMPYDLMLWLGPAPARFVEIGDLSLDVARRRAWRNGVLVPLTPLEFDLLLYHADDGRPVCREELLRELWGCQFDPGTNSVAVHVSRLRAKLGRSVVATASGGYLVAPGQDRSA